jgi:hypothetical protein
MGKYLNTLPTGNLPAKGKSAELLKNEGVSVINQIPTNLREIPEDKSLICVVDNGYFEAAAFIYDQRELNDFSDPYDKRPKTWLLVPTYISEKAQ